ncbi:hypothetical protein DI272_07115 [Streptomyces sp. Act143]|uniref:hypothetical protein n=1 Tax=Streptomyces sp. Act143 TaxID=2200760 RepID=UPI000D6814B0|nr:hypothetical protein [Streptomyces sp. Act143]PWI13949.1 hypothetical protein DI272_07115 [Streptomyces sp. Act143]
MYDDLSTRTVASDSFYAADTLVAAAGVVAAFIGIWAVLHVAHPRRRLNYTVSHAPLVPDAAAGSLEVSHNGTALVDPHVVTVVLHNPGRRDIASSAFDRGEPIRVRLGVPYAKLLTTASHPSAAQAPPARVQGSELHIGPGRLGSGTTITYRVLVDSVPGHECRHSLLDVRVERTHAATPLAL